MDQTQIWASQFKSAGMLESLNTCPSFEWGGTATSFHHLEKQMPCVWDPYNIHYLHSSEKRRREERKTERYAIGNCKQCVTVWNIGFCDNALGLSYAICCGQLMMLSVLRWSTNAGMSQMRNQSSVRVVLVTVRPDVDNFCQVWLSLFGYAARSLARLWRSDS